MRTRIKICGITNLDDARAAIDYGADALGFIFVPATPRYVGLSPDALAIPRQLPPFVSRVAVCTDISDLPPTLRTNFDAVQVYANTDLASHPAHLRVIRAFRVRDEQSLEEIAAVLAQFTPNALLLDAYHPNQLGGSGQTFHWEIAREAKARFSLPILLAGGLTPDNVTDAIAAARPYAVDVSSGVEAEPGRKDHAKLRAFIQAVRHFDASEHRE